MRPTLDATPTIPGGTVSDRPVSERSVRIGAAAPFRMLFDFARKSGYQERRLETYRLPLAVDIPDVEIIVLEHPEAEGPYGAKGVAEPPIVPVAAVIGNAVADAIGRPISRLPITPDDVLEALESQRSGE